MDNIIHRVGGGKFSLFYNHSTYRRYKLVLEVSNES